MQPLLEKIRKCTVCEPHLPMGARPIIEACSSSKIVLISQAPGRVVHKSGIPFQDQSGKKLREWLGVDEATFYDVNNFAILPIGLCYPGKAKSGDAPPRKECAPLWHQTVLKTLENVELKILIGSYAANYYLPLKSKNLTQKVGEYEAFLPQFWPIPHPSPVNRSWRVKNPWFEAEVVPKLQQRVKRIIKEASPLKSPC